MNTANINGVPIAYDVTGDGLPIVLGATGGIVAAALLPRLPELGSLMGLEPLELGIKLGEDIRSLAWRAAAAYVVIG